MYMYISFLKVPFPTVVVLAIVKKTNLDGYTGQVFHDYYIQCFIVLCRQKRTLQNNRDRGKHSRGRSGWWIPKQPGILG